MINMNYITPMTVSRYISFDREKKDWIYCKEKSSMFDKQAEGTAYIWNLLYEKRIALLADEVGMGKTMQALAVCSLLWRIKPDARILVIAPREVVAANWQNEFMTFLSNHYKFNDDIVKTSLGGLPIHEFVKCRNLTELALKAEDGCRHFYLIKTTSFSYVNREFQDREGNPDIDKIKAFFGKTSPKKPLYDSSSRAKYLGQCLREKITSAFDHKPFDLLIVDEAHYYRNKNGDSLRVNTASGFFGDKDTGRIADRVMMLTATPNHTSLKDIENIISYFTDVKTLLAKDDQSYDEQKTRSEYLLKAIALRRYRRLAGRIKYQYRDEQAIEADLQSNPESELFFALYQKRLVQHLKKANNRVFFGYLEGFESFSPSKDNVEDSIDEERKESTDFSKQIDTDILRKLSKVYNGCYGSKPSHPKYDRMIEIIVSLSEDYWSEFKQKNLIFVRRIPSLKEISQRVINNYDELFWEKILQAWNLYHTSIDFSKFQKKAPGRDDYYRITSGAEKTLGDEIISEDSDSEESGVETETEIPQSAVLDLFTVKKKFEIKGVSNTHASSFRLRFIRDESIFSLFFQPAVDYKSKAYRNVKAYTSTSAKSGRSRIFYETSAGMSRLEYSKNSFSDQDKALLKNFLFGEKVKNPGDSILQKPVETLWSIMWQKLEKRSNQAHHNCVISRIQNMKNFEKESLCLYLKKGILYASASLIELYCWFIEAQANEGTGEGHRLYNQFVSIVKKRIEKSLLFNLWARAALHFGIFKEKILGINDDLEILRNQRRLNIFNNMNPIYPYSGSSKNPSVISAFNTPFFPEHLVATSVLQEGVNLQYFCKNVHHYGIAWTPGDNEQRAGRIDRMFGLVEKELQENTETSLNIYYPFIKNTIDENQVAEFIYKKHQAEQLMDRCINDESSREIENRELILGKWKKFLRVKNPKADFKDPYYEDSNFDNNEEQYIFYDRGPKIAEIELFIKKLKGTLFKIINIENSGDKFAVYDLTGSIKNSRFICLLDPLLEEGRNQPVFVELNYSSSLSGLDPGTVFYLTLKTPLSSYTLEKEEKGKQIAEVYNRYKKIYPLVQIVFDETISLNSYFAIHMKTDLLLFREEGSEQYLSEEELKIVYRQLIMFTDIIEQKVFGDQDISKDRLMENEKDLDINGKVKNLDASDYLKPSDKRIDITQLPGWKSGANNVITRSKTISILGKGINDYTWAWAKNLYYPFIVFDRKNADSLTFIMHLSYPSVDVQDREIILLNRWFDYVEKQIARDYG